ncbi:MAG: hypothetical protein ACFCU6_08075, partial [Balneolaceae bacterium]
LSRFLDTTTRVSRSLARELQHSNAGKMIDLRRAAPNQISTEMNKLFNIDIEAHGYHFMDKYGEPYLKYFIKTDFGDAATYDQLVNYRSADKSLRQKYQIVNGIIARDSEYNPLYDSVKDKTLAQFDNAKYIDLDIALKDQVGSVTVTSELRNKDEYLEGEVSDNHVFKRYLKAVGNLDLPVETNKFRKDHLEMSDLLVGYTHDNPNNDFVSFELLHDRNDIPKGRNLHVYYEIYNLDLNEFGKSEYEVTYGLLKEKKSFLGLFKSEKPLDSSVTIYAEGNLTHDTQTIEIESSDYPEGSYILKIDIKDLINDNRISMRHPVNFIKK